jgi:hypothetical protein
MPEGFCYRGHVSPFEQVRVQVNDKLRGVVTGSAVNAKGQMMTNLDTTRLVCDSACQWTKMARRHRRHRLLFRCFSINPPVV